MKYVGFTLALAAACAWLFLVSTLPAANAICILLVPFGVFTAILVMTEYKARTLNAMDFVKRVSAALESDNEKGDSSKNDTSEIDALFTKSLQDLQKALKKE